MEPMYANCPNFSVYMSPDYSQFAVSQFGSSGISELSAYNSFGLAANYTQLASALGGDFNISSSAENSFPSNPEVYFNSGGSVGIGGANPPSSVSNITLPQNIHLGQGAGGSNGYLLPINNYSGNTITNFTYQSKGFVSPIASQIPVAFATPGAAGFDYVNNVNYGQKAIYSTPMRRLPYSGIANSRSQSVTKRASFSPIQSMGYNSRYGSMTFGSLVDPANGIFEPYVDFLFFDTSGRGVDMPHYRIVPDIYLLNRGSGVASVRFDITGTNGIAFSPKFFNVSGFMGPGTSELNSGIDYSNSLIQSNIIYGQNTPSGYVLPGQVLNLSVTGDESYNNGTGWGAVYGIIVSSGFYTSPLDLCLIDHNAWSGSRFVGFSGDNGVGVIPSPSGDNKQLYWPVKGSGLGLRITGLSYYLNGYGSFPDSGDYLANGNYQMIGDIVYTGAALLGTDFPTNDLYQYTGLGSNNNGDQLIYFTSNGTTPLSVANFSTLANPLCLQVFFPKPIEVYTGNLFTGHNNLSSWTGVGSIFSGITSGFTYSGNTFSGSGQYFSGITSGFSGTLAGGFSLTGNNSYGSGDYISGGFSYFSGSGRNFVGTGFGGIYHPFPYDLTGKYSWVSGSMDIFSGFCSGFSGTGLDFSGTINSFYTSGMNGCSGYVNSTTGYFTSLSGTGNILSGSGNYFSGNGSNITGQINSFTGS